MGPFGALFFVFTDSSALADELGLYPESTYGTDRIAALWRCDQFHDAELEILPRLADVQNDFLNCLILLSLCAESLERSAQHRLLIEYLSRSFHDHEMTRWLKLDIG